VHCIASRNPAWRESARVVEFAGRPRDEEVAAPRLARASRSTRARKSETCVAWDGVAFDENVLARPAFRETLTLLAGEPVLRKRVISLTGHYIVTRRAYEVVRPSWLINNAMLCSSTLRYADPPSSARIKAISPKSRNPTEAEDSRGESSLRHLT